MAEIAPNRKTTPPLVAWFEDINEYASRRLAPFIDIAIRIWLAQAFFRLGILKTTDPEPTIWLFTFVQPIPGVTPETATSVLTAIELVAPVLLLFGFFTRFGGIALLLSAALLHKAYPAVPDHLYTMLLLATTVIRGPGPISLDHKFFPSLVSSALPLTGFARNVGMALKDYVGPVYRAGLRVWLAFVLGLIGYAAFDGMAATDLEPFKRYGIMVMEPSTSVLTLAAGMVLFAGLLALGIATRLVAVFLTFSLVMIYATVGEAGPYGLMTMALLFIAFVGPGALSLDYVFKLALRRAYPGLNADLEWLADAPRVVIVGGGFAGIAAALELRHARAQVTLVDRRNYHLFQPLLYQVATATLSPADIATPIRALTRDIANCRVVLGRVTDIDTEDQAVCIGDRRIAYDHLVLATGAKHSYFGKDEWEPYAPGLKKIDDATEVRREILLAFEDAETTEDEAERTRLMTFVIVGGGPTGVELAGAIAELARQGMADEFDAIDPADSRIILVQSAGRVLPVMPERLSIKARIALERLGVEVRTGARVEEIDERGVVVAGERIDAGTVIWAAGVAASAAGRWVGAERDRAGRVIVNSDLSVSGCENVYAIGDTSSCDNGTGAPLPGLAAVAKQQGQYVAKLLRARIEGKRAPGPFRYRDFGSMATIGREKAVADLRGVQLSGTLAWWLWSVVHVAFMADARNRLAVILDWTWSYLTFSRRIRLITGGPPDPDS
jgi:NADH dehydrogenase FAD-containing subunit/uncharacterized membrane protein YphA (DoxX/SURF4 family)